MHLPINGYNANAHLSANNVQEYRLEAGGQQSWHEKQHRRRVRAVFGSPTPEIRVANVERIAL
jgi:hypothetical protein